VSTGQEQILMTDTSALDTSLATSNIAENQAALEGTAIPNIDGLDVRPHSVTTEHLYAADGTFHGELKAGTIFVGADGVVISSSEGGATPSTGLILTDTVLKLRYGGADTVVLDGRTGQMSATSFLLQTAASGARLEAGQAGVLIYDSDEALRTELKATGLRIIADDPATITGAQRVTFVADGSDTEGYIYLSRSVYTLTKTVG
jgi:hypothetical protein